MGAKACMALALWKPDRIASLVAVDNAPVDAALKSDFHQYVQGMKEVERVGVKSQKEADAILQPYVKVGEGWSGSWWPTVRGSLLSILRC
jgi:pimeloyl-ACP methyl ester carboxylesterase